MVSENPQIRDVTFNKEKYSYIITGKLERSVPNGESYRLFKGDSFILPNGVCRIMEKRRARKL